MLYGSGSPNDERNPFFLFFLLFFFFFLFFRFVALQEKNAPIPASLPKTGKQVVIACDQLVSVAKDLADDEYSDFPTIEQGACLVRGHSSHSLLTFDVH